MALVCIVGYFTAIDIITVAEQDMVLDHGVVGVGTRFSIVLVWPMILVMRQSGI